MKPSRRGFLKAAVAVPAAMTIGAASIVPVAATPLPAVVSAKPFEWWYSYDGGELFVETFNTRDQAMAHLKSCGEGMIAECQRQDFDLSMDGDTILEALYGQNEDRMNEDGDFLEPSGEQIAELGDVVTAAIYAWAEKHKINKEAWIFGEVRNHVEIKKPKPVKAA